MNRVSVRYQLRPLTKEHSLRYIDFQLSHAGGNPKSIDDSVKALIHDFTGGVPRYINNLATVLSTVDYVYDTFDRRIKKSVDADGPGSGAAAVSRYVYDGDHIALVFDGANNLKNRYLHGPVVDQILADENVATSHIIWPRLSYFS